MKDQQTVAADKTHMQQMETGKRNEKTVSRQRLVIHDLSSSSRLDNVVLILSEALREEFFNSAKFDLINRADIIHAIQEMKLQKAGLSDDQKALPVGK